MAGAGELKRELFFYEILDYIVVNALIIIYIYIATVEVIKAGICL